MRKSRRDYPGASLRWRRRFSPFMLVGMLVTVLVLLGGALVFIIPRLSSHASQVAPNMNCTLIVPDHPLSERGLATPYVLQATNPADGPCNEANSAQSAFVQGVIYNRANGRFGVYNPLIIDSGTRPALAPRAPRLPRGAVVGLWFGFNANDLLLRGTRRDTLAQARCVNGLGSSLFTQYAYCNAPAFFAAANQGIVAHRVHIPALGRARDGQPCPTVRDFSIVDQDQSDNVQTQYLSMPDGRIAQFSAANQARLRGSTVLANPSDNALLTRFVDPLMGCHEWEAPNLADKGSPVAALALDELQASAEQRAPVALVPLNDPMTMLTHGDDTLASLAKTDIYRRGVDQILAFNDRQASGTNYCKNLMLKGMPRLELDKPLTIDAASPDAAAANSLFTFLAQRFQASYTNLGCQKLLKLANPVTTQTDNDGVVISASYTLYMTSVPTPTTTPLGAPAPPSAPNCSFNGQLINGCTGTVTINGQACSFSFTNNTVALDCPQQSH